MKCFKLILLIGILPMISSRHVPFFRKDYTYIDSNDAFYKIHWDSNGISWDAAFLACDEEGAKLFYPKQESEQILVRSLMESFKEAPNVSEIFVGLHNKFGVGEFATVDGHPTSSPLSLEEPSSSSDLPGGRCVLMNTVTLTYRIGPCLVHPDMPLPYVCKKEYDELCPTVDRGYKYMESSRKCYKVINRLKTWDEAMRTCYMEGGTLAAIEANEDLNQLFRLLKTDTKYYAGYRRMFSESDYYTVKGHKFDDFYLKSDDRPEKNRDCGAYYYNRNVYSKYIDCNSQLPFICEMESKMSQN